MSKRTFARIALCSVFAAAALVICQGRSSSTEVEPEPMEQTVIEQQEITCTMIDIAEPDPVPARYQAIAESISQEERGLMAMVVYHEARGQIRDGQKAVAEVICNRVLSEKFPNNAKAVIYQKEPLQFSCSPVLTTVAYKEPAALAFAFDVVEEVLSETETVIPGRYLFFRTGKPNTSDYMKIGDHYFY